MDSDPFEHYPPLPSATPVASEVEATTLLQNITKAAIIVSNYSAYGLAESQRLREYMMKSKEMIGTANAVAMTDAFGYAQMAINKWLDADEHVKETSIPYPDESTPRA